MCLEIFLGWHPWAAASKSVAGSTIRGLSVRQRGSSDIFDIVEISEQGRNIYMATWDRSSGVFSAFTYVGAVRKSTPLSCIAACSHLWLCRCLCPWLCLCLVSVSLSTSVSCLVPLAVPPCLLILWRADALEL